MPYFNYMKPLVLSFPTTKHSPNKDCLHLLRSLCSRTPLFKSYNFWIFSLVVLSTAMLANSSTLAQEFVKQRRSKSPAHKGGLQIALVVSVDHFSSLPLSSQALLHSTHTKWWLSCVTFRMGKSKTNAQILKIAINLLTQMRNG